MFETCLREYDWENISEKTCLRKRVWENISERRCLRKHVWEKMSERTYLREHVWKHEKCSCLMIRTAKCIKFYDENMYYESTYEEKKTSCIEYVYLSALLYLQNSCKEK